MLFSRSEGHEVEPPGDTLFKGFGNLYSFTLFKGILAWLCMYNFFSDLQIPRQK